MEDREIVRLYFARSEQALVETQAKYGAYCYSIAYNILTNSQDAEECVSDTYLAAWNRIPPKKPDYLGAFLGRITRYLSIDRWRSRRSQKRGGGGNPQPVTVGDCIGALAETESGATLAWVQGELAGGLGFTLYSDDLSGEELLILAQSVKGF